MLREFIRAAFDDSVRGDDRAGRVPGREPPAPALADGASPESTAPIRPLILRRRTTMLVAAAGFAAIIYGTLVPFEIDLERPFTWSLPLGRPASGDALANVLIYIPIGAFLRLIFRRRGSAGWIEWVLGLGGAVGLSYLTEVLQHLVPARVPCWTDVLCNSAGGLIGVVLAPRMQRGLRNLHAFLYDRLRSEPFSAAAGAALVCLCVFALTPPDLYPAPGHVSQEAARFLAAPAAWLGLNPEAPPAWLEPGQFAGKLASASAYGLLAFLLALSAVEAGRTGRAATWYALSRSAGVVLIVEALQLFTISHVADARDMILGGCSGAMGALAGGFLILRRPGLHRQPLAVLRATTMALTWGLLAWILGEIALQSPPSAAAPTCWIPLVDNFHLSWNALLGSYISGLLRYSLVSGALVARARANRDVPRWHFVAGSAVAIALLSGSVDVCQGSGFDVGQVMLALVASGLAMRLDHAVFGRRQSVAEVVTS